LTETRFFTIQGLHFSGDGTLYIADSLASGIFSVGADGLVKKVAGTGRSFFSGDGPATTTSLSGPGKLTTTPSGVVYFRDGLSSRRIVNGMVETLPLHIPAAQDWTAGPQDLVVLVASGRPVLRFDAHFELRVVAGREETTNTDVPLHEVFLRRPVGMVFDSEGTLYIADGSTRAIYRVGDSLEIVTEASKWPSIGNLQSTSLGGLAIDSRDRLYFSISNPSSNTGLVLRIDASGFTTVAGGGILPVPRGTATTSMVDATAASFRPAQILIGADDELFIYSDIEDRLLHVNTQGRIGTAPVGEPQIRQNQVAHFLSLSSMTAAPDGTVYVADSRGSLYRIRDGVVERTGEPVGSVVAAGMNGRIFLSRGEGLFRQTWGGSAEVIL
jgi:hypothetical protein